MAQLSTKINTQSEAFESNRTSQAQAWDAVCHIEKLKLEKSYSAAEKFAKRGQLLPHERLNLLLDPGQPFLELCALAGHKMYDDKTGEQAGGGIIAGIGLVQNTRCLIVANNSAIKGGTISPMGLQKSLRLQRIALDQKLPVITLAESGGANLNYAAEVFVEGARGFANQARLSAAGIPQITIVHGNATAGGAYQPGLSDYVILVKARTQMFLAGPPLLKAATGEIATEEDLGGAALHAQTSGTGEYMADNDAHAIQLARNLVNTLNWPKATRTAPETIKPPRYPQSDLMGMVSSSLKTPLNTLEVLARLADDSDWVTFKNDWDTQTLCGWITLHNHRCGVISNNGPITPQGASKAAQFLQLCQQTQRPVIFLHNTTGFQVGVNAERNGIIKHGAKMLQAVANLKVPKISIIIGGSFGAGNYAMCGRGLDPDFIFAWPNSKTAVMGAEQAGKVMRIVADTKQKRRGLTPDPKVLDMIETTTKNSLEKTSGALYGSARLWDDGLIHPAKTRDILGFLLDTMKQARSTSLSPNSFGVARL